MVMANPGGFTRGSFPKFSTVPEATYRVRIAKVEKRMDEKTEEQFLNVTLVIQNEEQLGRHLFLNLPLDPKHQWANRTRQLLDTVDYPEDLDLTTDEGLDALIDREFDAVTVIKKNKDGEEQNQIKKFLAIGA